MFTAMAPLPARPTFSVYGLSDAFTGLRWLALWQHRAGAVTEVLLGHGHPDAGSYVVVRTVLKQPEQRLGHGAGQCAIGVEYVASNVVLNAVEREVPDRDEAWTRLMHEQGLIDETDDGGATLNGWRAESIAIDGTAHRGHVRDIGQHRAIVVEFATLVVGIDGPTRHLTPPLSLVDVSKRLGDYAAGSHERADSLLD